MPERFRPKAKATMAEQNTGRRADMFRLAAWITENGAHASIKDGYDVQGPDLLCFRNDHDDEVTTVFENDWVVLLSFGNFKKMDHDSFRKTYESVANLKPGDS